MRLAIFSGPLLALPFLLSPMVQALDQSALPLGVANDNRSPAGHLQNGILELKLELRAACWYPEAADGGHVDAYAFAEVGGPPQISGPLIRVPQGTQIHLSVRNTLAESAKTYGFQSHPAATNEPLRSTLRTRTWPRVTRPRSTWFSFLPKESRSRAHVQRD